MFRTRDFILFFVTIVFLLVAIISTATRNSNSNNLYSNVMNAFEMEDGVEYTAVIDSPKLISREERLSTMRDKIASDRELGIYENVEMSLIQEEYETEALLLSEDETETAKDLVTNEVFLCQNYKPYAGNWNPNLIEFSVVEGVRLVSRKDEFNEVVGNVSSTLLQLPMYSVPSGGKFCLPNDVIGIAQDGSLIRNSETGLYGIFGENTLIGYALDGFPIYGITNIKTDSCGGLVVDGEYRYYLSANRDTIVNCFSIQPIGFD